MMHNNILQLLVQTCLMMGQEIQMEMASFHHSIQGSKHCTVLIFPSISYFNCKQRLYEYIFKSSNKKEELPNFGGCKSSSFQSDLERFMCTICLQLSKCNNQRDYRKTIKILVTLPPICITSSPDHIKSCVTSVTI